MVVKTLTIFFYYPRRNSSKKEQGMTMNKILSEQNLANLNFDETKRKVKTFFIDLEKLEWEWAKLNAQKGLSAKYDWTAEYQKEPYSPIGKDEFDLSVKDYKEEQIRKYISNYYWAKNSLSEVEQIYIDECFVNHKYEDELADLVDMGSADCNEFRLLKKSAIYKFADFLNLLVEKNRG